jgi:pyridoxine/pyridoxamine 5'-phosphate oxidase
MPSNAQPTKAELVAFIRAHKWGVVASTGPSGEAQAAVVGIAVTDELEVVFDTLGSTRKAANLRRDARVAVVIGWDEAQTVQLEGVADEPVGAELARIQAAYFAAFADGPTRLAWPGITYFRVRPRWLRYSDFRGAEPAINEVSFPPA